ncbi:hypothetical protein PV327_004512, partial [Microctonus hyperodae]
MIDLKKEVGSRRWDKVCNKGDGNHGEYAAAAAAVHEKPAQSSGGGGCCNSSSSSSV